MNPDNHIYWRDEILQLLFWMRGEGMGDSHHAGALAKLLSLDVTVLRPHLDAMASDGYLVAAGDGFALSGSGVAEGGRRFKEEFETLISQGHGECNDPDCDCHELGPESCHSRQEQRV